jgi:hypothetical protein
VSVAGIWQSRVSEQVCFQVCAWGALTP